MFIMGTGKALCRLMSIRITLRQGGLAGEAVGLRNRYSDGYLVGQ